MNVSFSHTQNQQQNCPSMYKEMYYRANKWTPELMSVGRGYESSVFNQFKGQN